MFAYKRLNQLFIQLYSNVTCTAGALSRRLSVSERTIRNDLSALNDVLKDYDTQVVTIRGQGYQLRHKDKVASLFEQLTSLPDSAEAQLETSEDRMKQLLLLLLRHDDYLSLDELCDTIFVGRTTLLGYIRQLRPMLTSYDLKISSKTNIGYRISGSEINIRQCLSEQLVARNFNSYISQFSSSEKALFQEIDLEDIGQHLTLCFPPDRYQISDYNRKNFIIHLAIAILRVKGNHLVEESPTLTLFDTTVQPDMERLLDWVEQKYTLTFGENDRVWLFGHFFTELQPLAHSEEQATRIQQLIRTLLCEMNDLFGENLLEDDVLNHDLFVHFSSYLPLKQLLKIKKNPLLSAIKKNYSYAFELTVLTITNNPLLREQQLTEDDIGYVALHIAAAIERKQQSSSPNKRVLIVCGQGVSTSRLIEAVIKKRFPEGLTVVDIISYAAYQLREDWGVDLIISTIPLTHPTTPIVQIDFLAIKNGLDEINRLLESDEKGDALHSLFDPELFVINKHYKTRDALIRSLGKLLEDKHLVPATFSAKVIERENIAPTNLTALVAMPHSIDPEIRTSKIIVCVSKEPVRWSGESSAKLIFLLAVAEKDKERLQIFFEYLSEIVDNEKLQNQLAAASDFHTFIHCLQSM